MALSASAKLRKVTVIFVVCPSVLLSVRKEQLGFRWTNFHQILCLSIFRKYAQKIQVSLKSDYVTCRTEYLYITLQLDSSQNVTCFKQILQRNKKHTLCSSTFSPKIVLSVRSCGKMRQSLRSQTQHNNVQGRMDFECCVTNATNTGSECVTLSPLRGQQQLHHSLSTLRFTYISVLVLCFPLF